MQGTVEDTQTVEQSAKVVVLVVELAVGEVAADLGDQRNQELGVEEGHGLRDGGAVQGVDVQVLTDAGGLAGVLDAAEAAGDGVKEGQEEGHQEVVIQEDTVGVVVVLAQGDEELLDLGDLPQAQDKILLELLPRLAAAALGLGCRGSGGK